MTRCLRLTTTRLPEHGDPYLTEEWINPDHIVHIETHLADQVGGPTLSLLLTLSTGILVFVPVTSCPDPALAADLADEAIRALLEQLTTQPLSAVIP